jgi:hypothetical protein
MPERLDKLWKMRTADQGEIRCHIVMTILVQCRISTIVEKREIRVHSDPIFSRPIIHQDNYDVGPRGSISVITSMAPGGVDQLIGCVIRMCHSGIKNLDHTATPMKHGKSMRIGSGIVIGTKTGADISGTLNATRSVSGRSVYRCDTSLKGSPPRSKWTLARYHGWLTPLINGRGEDK